MIPDPEVKLGDKTFPVRVNRRAHRIAEQKYGIEVGMLTQWTREKLEAGRVLEMAQVLVECCTATALQPPTEYELDSMTDAEALAAVKPLLDAATISILGELPPGKTTAPAPTPAMTQAPSGTGAPTLSDVSAPESPSRSTGASARTN